MTGQEKRPSIPDSRADRSRLVAALTGMFGPSLGLHSAFSTGVYVPPCGYSHLGMSLFLTLGRFVITPCDGSIGSLKADA